MPVLDVVLVWRRIARAVAPVLGLAVRMATGFVASGLSWLGAWLRPQWIVGLVAVGCAAALGLSQFVHYTGIEVDSLAYGGRLQTVAPPPSTGFRDAGSAHAYALLPVAVIAALLVPLTIRGHWRFGRLIALCGLAAIAVTLLIDLPKGLDTGRLGISYVGVKAQLTDGFYAQLSASAMLVFCGMLLSSILRRQAPAPVRRRRRIGRPPRGAAAAPTLTRHDQRGARA
jgi:hypothetical protein